MMTHLRRFGLHGIRRRVNENMDAYSNVFLLININESEKNADMNTSTSKTDYDIRKYSAGDSIYSEKIMLEILECFDKKDKERLKSLFSDEVKKESTLEEEIDKAFLLYQGKSVEYDILYATGVAQANKENGEYTFKNAEPKLYGIRTDSGKVYSLIYGSVLVNQDNPNSEGVTWIQLFDIEEPKKEDVPVAVIGDY